MEKAISQLIQEKGPLTGAELWETLGEDGLLLWRACKRSPNLVIRAISKRYLRLDRRVTQFARLSPSIFREFITYSVVGLSGRPEAAEKRLRELAEHIRSVSRSKWDLAYRTVEGLAADFEDELPLEDRVSFVIAGDIVYDMAHDVPRRERSTGKTVNGSDMDIVVLADDRCGEGMMKRLDAAIYQRKLGLLTAPHIREEIDYVVKRIERVRDQARFNTFRHMLACKILQEGELLWGSKPLFEKAGKILRDSGVTAKLEELESLAARARRRWEAYLLEEDPDRIREEGGVLFYPVEESEEFE